MHTASHRICGRIQRCRSARYIVLGYDRLRGRINDLLLERDPLCDLLYKRDLDVYSGFPRCAVFSEKFYYDSVACGTTRTFAKMRITTTANVPAITYSIKASLKHHTGVCCLCRIADALHRRQHVFTVIISHIGLKINRTVSDFTQRASACGKERS